MAQNIILSTELGQEFLIGAETPNLITIAVDGTTITKPGNILQAEQATLTYDNTTTILTYTAPGQAPMTIDLSALTTDVFVNGGSFNPTTNVLTLVDNDGVSPDIVVDLSALLGVSTDANNILVNGTDGRPYLDTAALGIVSTDANNLITAGADGGAFLDCDKVKDDCGTECFSVFNTSLGFMLT